MRTHLVSLLAVSALALAGPVAAATMSLPLDPSHTSARFSVSHLTITKVTGQIPVTKSTLTLDNDFPTTIDATLDATKIETQDEGRDRDLRSEKWFDTTQYPVITYHSTKITRLSGNAFTVLGNLTMHGITQPVTLTATYNGMQTDPMGHVHYGYSASGKIKRDEFKVGQAPAAIVGNEIALEIEAEAVKK